MSIHVIKPGIADAFYDRGRFGHQHLGINPTGVMDEVAMKVANMLVGNHWNEAVLEMHFPASELLIKQDIILAISGADFNAVINNHPIQINKPYLVKKGSLFKCNHPVNGARLYLAVKGGFKLNEWLNSYSTNLQCQLGGYLGRILQKNDQVDLKLHKNYEQLLKNTSFIPLPFFANIQQLYGNAAINIVQGLQYNQLDHRSLTNFTSQWFTITAQSNRMGYRLQGVPLSLIKQESLISAAVTKGTIQLLPDGQLIILMADHQTTGGYPVVGHVATTALPALAQLKAGATLMFNVIDHLESEKQITKQHQHLIQLHNACNFQLAKYF